MGDVRRRLHGRDPRHGADPDGPASLGFPALSTGTSVNSPGALVGPDGPPQNDPTTPDDTRGSLGQAGGYPGFSETLDTSVRGDLGDESSCGSGHPSRRSGAGRRSPSSTGAAGPCRPTLGRAQQGPNIPVLPTLGDEANPTLETDELIQTYFVEADLPNVLFAAHRPTTVIFDGTVWTRPDGALRSDVTLTDGSVYTVVSDRIRVTPELLRSQGDVAEVFATSTMPHPGDAGAVPRRPGLDLGADLALAAELTRPGESTYDTVLAYEAWLGANTEYDLNAPVPAAESTPSTTSCSSHSAGSASRSPARSR